MEEHNKTSANNETVTIKKETLWKYSTFVLAALLIVMVFVFFTGDKPAVVTGNVVANPTNPAPTVQPSTVTATADDDARQGKKDAPIEIIEFSDFQCPFCSRALPALDQVKTEYGDKVSIVYRDFPLVSIHPNAQKAAEASECVREKGKDVAYWKMHDKMFANQETLSVDNLKAWAKEIGYDISSCLDSGKFADEVAKDTKDGMAATCTGTPCFVVNIKGTGYKINGAQPFANFKQVIDAGLAK